MADPLAIWFDSSIASIANISIFCVTHTNAVLSQISTYGHSQLKQKQLGVGACAE